MARLQLRKRWFNPLYFILLEALKDKKIRKILVYGGKGSSKTVSITQVLSKLAYVNNASSISFRKESTTIPSTLKKSFDLAHTSMHMENGFESFDRRYDSTCNGAELLLKGMDDSEKAKGVEGYRYLYFDELNQFSAKEFSDANISLRGQPGQKIFGSWNPVDELSWIKVEIIDKTNWHDTDKFGKLPCENSFIRLSEDGTILLIKTTYEDNYWIAGHPTDPTIGFRDEAVIAEYNLLATLDPNSHKVNVLGEWGKSTYGGEFFKKWRSNIHTGDFPYQNHLALYLMFDENTSPYFPCAFYQTEEKDGVKWLYLVDAISAKHPDNGVRYMCNEIKTKLRGWGHERPIYVGGDSTSVKDDVKQEKGHDLFKLIINGLTENKEDGTPIWDIRRFVQTNPSVAVSAQFTNLVLEHEYEKIRIRVDRKLRTPVLDYENTKEHRDGGVDKTTIKDPITKVAYQPWGHYCDIKRYTVVSIFNMEYKKFQSYGLLIVNKGGAMTKKNRW